MSYILFSVLHHYRLFLLQFETLVDVDRYPPVWYPLQRLVDDCLEFLGIYASLRFCMTFWVTFEFC